MLFFSATVCFSQGWMLKLSSNVELRSWKLTSSAAKSEKSLGGASIALYKGESLLSQTTSDGNGDFVIDVPANGDFILKISFAGCNTKKFFVSTNGVPENVSNDNFKPTVVIGGFVMSKPLKGVDYIGLNEPLVKVEYKGKGQNFDKDEVVTNRGMDIVSKIYDAENSVIQKFCNYNKAGDDALKKNNCPLAKSYYLKAMDLLPDEPYPGERLKMAEDCLLKKKQNEEALAVENSRKAEEQKAAQEKKKQESEQKKKEDEAKSLTAQKKAEEEKVKKISQEEKKSAINTVQNGSENKNNEIKVVSKDDDAKAGVSGTGNSKYSVKQVLGADKYRENIKKADDYYKTKRYNEAKAAYADALKIKPGDAYASERIAGIDKLQGKK